MEPGSHPSRYQFPSVLREIRIFVIRFNQTPGWSPSISPFNIISKVTGQDNGTDVAPWPYSFANNIHNVWPNRSKQCCQWVSDINTIDVSISTKKPAAVGDGRLLELVFYSCFCRTRFTRPFQSPEPSALPHWRASKPTGSWIFGACSSPSKRAHCWHPD